MKTGKAIKNRFHTQKAKDSIKFLNKWIKNNPNANLNDRAAAENIIRDLQNALDGK